MGDATNKTLIFELTDSNTGEGAVETETVNKDRLGDELVGRDFLEDTFISLLVEDNHVVCLVLNLLSRPLLLGLLASGRGCGLGSSVLLGLSRKTKWFIFSEHSSLWQVFSLYP
jgi:hypothetical protein